MYLREGKKYTSRKGLGLQKVLSSIGKILGKFSWSNKICYHDRPASDLHCVIWKFTWMISWFGGETEAMHLPKIPVSRLRSLWDRSCGNTDALTNMTGLETSLPGPPPQNNRTVKYFWAARQESRPARGQTTKQPALSSGLEFSRDDVVAECGFPIILYRTIHFPIFLIYRRRSSHPFISSL